MPASPISNSDPTSAAPSAAAPAAPSAAPSAAASAAGPAPTPWLDRRAEARLDPHWIEAACADPSTQYLVSRGAAHLIQRRASQPELPQRELPPREQQAQIAFVGPGHPLVAGLDASRLVLLGWFHGARCVLADLPEGSVTAPADAPPGATPPGANFEELRPLVAMLPEDQAQLLVYARALLLWRSRQRHCGVCGAPTAARSAGHVLACTRCGTDFFPRIDPAIIVLVSDASRALLGRQSSWAPGRYSALAGFVEAGESLEEAVVREVHEETGARVTWVRYFASQPWPFPASLMLGFHARARAAQIKLDGELEDARWFELEQLRSAPEGLLPPPHTIARRLIEAWVQEQSGATNA
jgi:NAD+ diphosphatase